MTVCDRKSKVKRYRQKPIENRNIGRKMTNCYMTGKCQNLTLNQRVPGSSPGAPTIEASENTDKSDMAASGDSLRSQPCHHLVTRRIGIARHPRRLRPPFSRFRQHHGAAPYAEIGEKCRPSRPTVQKLAISMVYGGQLLFGPRPASSRVPSRTVPRPSRAQGQWRRGGNTAPALPMMGADRLARSASLEIHVAPGCSDAWRLAPVPIWTPP